MQDQKKQLHDIQVSVTGLGYVGLPVAVHMAKKFKTVGFDVNQSRIDELNKGQDSTLEVEPKDLKEANIKFSSNASDLKECNFHIIAVPTPISKANIPNLNALRSSSKSIGSILKKGDIVVYESTVYPGATEEVCLPILLEESGLSRSDFNIGYSPERINPGDKEHSFDKIRKVVSADTPETLKTVSAVYSSVVTAGIFEAKTIKVAEAAKVIENTQRDLNIALMNELCLIFDKMDINIHSVLEAAGTKWNFLKFTPGLVGGHCIGVDPYYLTYKAKELGYHPEVILAGRKINDGMGQYVASKLVKQLVKNGLSIKGQQVNILGLTFKENCPDLRNTRVTDIIDELKDYGMNVSVSDEHASKTEALHEYGIELVGFKDLKPAVATVVAVKHKEYLTYSPESFGSSVVFDIKGLYSEYQGSQQILFL